MRSAVAMVSMARKPISQHSATSPDGTAIRRTHQVPMSTPVPLAFTALDVTQRDRRLEHCLSERMPTTLSHLVLQLAKAMPTLQLSMVVNATAAIHSVLGPSVLSLPTAA